MAERTPFLDDLLEAFAQPGCALCRLLAQSSDGFVDRVLYEAVTDPPTRENFNAARGYCLSHAQLLLRAGAALGVTIMLDGVLRLLLRHLDENPVQQLDASKARNLLQSLGARVSQPAAQDLARSLEGQIPCPACTYEADMLSQIGHTFVNELEADNGLASAFSASQGLCLDHFTQVIPLAQPGGSLTVLVNTQVAIWQQLHEQAVEFIRKNDHRYRGEPFGEEKDIWIRALAAISGSPIGNYVNPKGLTQN